MTYYELDAAFSHATSSMAQAERCAKRAAEFLGSRLRLTRIDTETLRKFKRELQNFDAKRGKWRRN